MHFKISDTKADETEEYTDEDGSPPRGTISDDGRHTDETNPKKEKKAKKEKKKKKDKGICNM